MKLLQLAVGLVDREVVLVVSDHAAVGGENANEVTDFSCLHLESRNLLFLSDALVAFDDD